MKSSGFFSLLGLLVAKGRYFVILFWMLAALGAFLYLPPLDDRITGNLSDLVPEPDNFVSGPAANPAQNGAAEPEAPTPPPAEEPGTDESTPPTEPGESSPPSEPEGVPSESSEGSELALSGVVEAPAMLVFSDPDGFGAAGIAEVERRLSLLDGPDGPYRLVRAVPVGIEGSGLAGFEEQTTLPVLLFFEPGISPTGIGTGTEEARNLADDGGGSIRVEATGIAPAQNDSANAIRDSLPTVTVATFAVIFLILAVTYRSPITPIVPLASIGVAIFLTLRLLAYFAEMLGVQIPSQVEPVIIVLLFGVGTDYSLFVLSRTRQALAAGANRVDAAREGVARAGAVVASSAAVLIAAFMVLVGAELEIYRALGPGLALALLVATLVTLTLVPALLAVFGRLAFGGLRFSGEARRRAGLVERHPAAIVAVLAAILLTASLGIFGLRVGFDQIQALPEDAPASRGYAALSEGFPSGILAPVNVIVGGENLNTSNLERLKNEMWFSGGYAAVIGPDDSSLVPGVEFLAPDGSAARFVLVFYGDPYSPESLDQIQTLRDDLPAMLDRAGLEGAEASAGGQAVLAAEARSVSEDDLTRLAPLVFAATFIVLSLLLRTPIAPIYLLAATALGFAATLGAATVFFQNILGHEGVVYYVPFALFLLLVALGSDYNIFIMAAIKDEGRTKPLREAVGAALAGTGRTINAAGLALAASFALLALIPLQDFQQIGLTVAAGVLLDAFVIRIFLVPSLAILAGRVGFWPARKSRG
ncbi:MAG: MMPL family transporter [Rubrobacter sp.]|nr:MMPL family transporter [Rubrobacter sp.]